MMLINSPVLLWGWIDGVSVFCVGEKEGIKEKEKEKETCTKIQLTTSHGEMPTTVIATKPRASTTL